MAAAELALYEELAAVHEQMLAAASALAWDELVRLEMRSAGITRQLAAGPAAPTNAEDRRRTVELIRAILARQAQVREAVSAWRDDVAPLLTAFESHYPGP